MIQIEENPIWDEFKNRLFNIDYQGAFSFSELKIGSKFKCYSCLAYFVDSIQVGIATLNITNYDEETKCLEINIAVDKKHNSRKGIGTELLKKMEEIAMDSEYKLIIAIVKSTNKSREKTAEWFISKEYSLEGILNQDDLTSRKRYYKDFFPIRDLTLSKNL